MLCHRPRVVEGSNVIATYNIASYNVIRRPAQTPARTRNVLRCHWGLWDALSARGLNRKRHPSLKVKSGRSFRLKTDSERVSRSGAKYWVVLSAKHAIRKARPVLSLNSGMNFPLKHLLENVSRSKASFWDALSAERLPFFEKYTSLNLPGLHNLLPFTGADHRPPIRM